MNSFPLSVQAFCRWLLMAGGVAILGAGPAVAQTPKSEGSDDRPSYYHYPLRTWTQQTPARNLGLLRPDGRQLRPKDRHADLAAIISKLQGIVIPRIEFRNTTLADAVEFLRQESRRLDPDADPESRGVNIFLRLPKPLPMADTFAGYVPGMPLASASPAPADANTHITLTMERLPLLESLRYLALQTGMKVQIEQYAVFIVPLADETFVTAEYLVPPELLGLPMDVNSSPTGGSSIDETTVRWPGMKGWFDAKGIAFPQGASATYLGSVHKLVVRNTQENLDKIAALFSPAREIPTPTPTDP